MKHYKVVVDVKPIEFVVLADNEVEAYEEVIKEISTSNQWFGKFKVANVAAEEMEN